MDAGADAAGELVVMLGEERGYPKGPRWADAPNAPLKERINEILGDTAAAFDERRLQRIREAERRAEEHRRSMERYRQGQERKREVVRFRRLVDGTEDRRTATEIRNFVAFVEASPAPPKTPNASRGGRPGRSAMPTDSIRFNMRTCSRWR